jgi:hypothetical protein
MKITQVAQHAEDLDRARDFYARLLNTQPAGYFNPPGLVSSGWVTPACSSIRGHRAR